MSGEIVRESGRNFPARSELHSHSETACRHQTQEFAALAGGMPLAALIGARRRRVKTDSARGLEGRDARRSEG